MSLLAPPSRRSIPTALRHTVGPLRARSFRRWFLSQVLSGSGAATQAVGQAWLVVQMHRGGLALALVSGAMFVPSLLFAAPLGALIDRFDLRRFLIGTQLAQACIAALLAALTALGFVAIWELAILALATGIVMAADAPGRQVYAIRLAGD